MIIDSQRVRPGLLWSLVAWTLFLSGACSPAKEQRDVSARIRSALEAAGPARLVRLGGEDTLTVGPAAHAFYRERGFAAAWLDLKGKGLVPQGAKLLEVLSRSGEDGLLPERYRLSAAHRLAAQLEEEEELGEEAKLDASARLDIALTEAFLRYADDLAQGMIDPEAAGLEWRIPRASPADRELLARVVRAAADGSFEDASPEQVLASLRPTTPYYARLRQALVRHDSIARAGGWPEVAEGKLRVGQASPAASALRARLIAEGDPEETSLAQRGAAAPDVFDEDLESALEHFQERHGIDADGRLGAATLAELNHTVEERILEIKVNMDRWRWLPRDLGERYVLVNVAGQELEVIEQHQPIMSMRVVVGQQGWQTPIFGDTMEHVVFNPYWNVPETILREEVIPAMKRDPTYLARNNYEVSRKGGRLAVRQRPGRGNALGKVKFLFPNKDDVYLHDTPADHLFSRSRRTFSHGCIRLEKPLDLARLVLEKQTGMSPDRVESLAAGSSQRWVKLDRPLPVYILYFTAWADANGSMHYYHDVYDHDEKLHDAARQKLVGGPRHAAAPVTET